MKVLIWFIFSIQIFAVEWISTIEDALAEAKASEKGMFAYFADQTQCGMCKTFQEKITSNEKLGFDIHDYIFCRIDPLSNRSEESLSKYQDLFRKFHIDAIPTIMLFTPQGKVFFRSVYNGEEYTEYISMIKKVIETQSFYVETFEFVNTTKTFTIEERNYINEELVKYMDTCPKEATILMAKLAQLLFFFDINNDTNSKAKAAYFFCLYAHNVEKQLYIDYLKYDYAKNNSGYYRQLFLEYFKDQSQYLAEIYNLLGKDGVSQNNTNYTKQIIAELQNYLDNVKEDHTDIDILTTYLLCYYILSDLEKVDYTWKQIEQYHSENEKTSHLKEFFKVGEKNN